MSEKLTREQIESWKTEAAYTHDEVLEIKFTPAELTALCNMALAWLEVQPRPISEAPKDTALLVIEKGSGFSWEIAHFNTYRKAWVRNIDGVPISIPTHFIILSSLPEPK